MSLLDKGERWRVVCGDALAVLQGMPDASVDAVVTDPPYSSGGFTRGDRNGSVADKYVQTGTQIARPSFSGDNRDQRSWVYWCSLWMAEAQRVARPGAIFACFTDWRQLPSLTDAVQCGGWLWRGLIAWDKGDSARAPHCGYFRHQCEYVVWCSNGALVNAIGRGPWPGYYRVPVVQSDKHHITGKPTALMAALAECVPPGGLILDPFAGSGTTGVGALSRGRRFFGIEKEAAYCTVARERLAAAAAQSALPIFESSEAAR